MEFKIHCKHDELINPSKLKNHPKNRNKHGQDQVERLSELYKYHGIRHPIIVSNLSKCIVAGHGRKLAAIRAGIKQMPVVYQDFESSESEYAFIQADNAIALWAELDMAGINSDIGDLGPDFDINMLGIQDFTLDVAEKDFEGDPDEIPEDIEPQAKLGQIYKLGEHRLMCGSSTDRECIEKLINKNKIDMVFTDPPYGMSAVSKSGVLSANYRGDILGDENTDVARDSYNLAMDMFEGAHHVWWGANYYCSHLKDAECWIVWDKNNGGSDQTDCELAWTNFRSVVRQFTQASEKTNRVHPTQKPCSLIEWVFDKFKFNEKNVIDLFGGSGSTLIACEKTNRKCFMMELDCFYISVIIERWQKFTGKEAYLLNNDGTETPYNELKNVKQ